MGGAWELLEGRFLVGAGNTYTLGAEGGEAEHTLTEAELPSISGAFAIRRTMGDNITITNTAGKMSHVASSSTQNIAGLSYGNTAYQKADVVTMAFGDNQPHNNLPPYKAVFMWQRVS